MKDEKDNNQLNIELSDEMAEGTYSNLAIIAHSSSEFIIDFIRVMPNSPKAKVKSRVILNAEHAKRLLLALRDNVVKYEEKYGEIELPERGVQIPMNLTGTKGEA